eukprot:381093-Pyramimonas_sp.AAC.2
MDAWKAAVEKTQRHHGTRQRYPIDALNQLLVAYGCMGGSSSGVEQGFSKVLKNISPQSSGGSSTSSLEHHLTKLILDKQLRSADELDKMHAEARQVWIQCYGACRQGGPPGSSVNAGVRKAISHAGDEGGDQEPDKKKRLTEIGWLRCRREGVQQAKQSRSSQSIDVDLDGGDDYMTDKHRKEMEFNADKELKKRIAAFKDGTLLQSEITADLEAQATDHDKHQASVDRARLRAEDRVKTMSAGGRPWPREHLHGLNAFLPDDVDSREVRDAMVALGLQRVSSRSEAKVNGRPNPPPR